MYMDDQTIITKKKKEEKHSCKQLESTRIWNLKNV